MAPSWASSKSGTCLAQTGDGWVYRKGMRGLDALQVVALEERIISSGDAYPSGKQFWEAVDALRLRGPPHTPSSSPARSPLNWWPSSPTLIALRPPRVGGTGDP